MWCDAMGAQLGHGGAAAGEEGRGIADRAAALARKREKLARVRALRDDWQRVRASAGMWCVVIDVRCCD